MKHIHTFWTGFAFIASTFMSCESTIHPDLQPAPSVLVVDAWLNTNPGDQYIQLTQSQPYFDQSPFVGSSGATITVKNETDGRTFIFLEVANQRGSYRWIPSTLSETLGNPGDRFSLAIVQGSEQYTATSIMGRVPPIDSISFSFAKGNSFFPDAYLADFWATEPLGVGDTYWIKAYKNDTLLLKPNEIILAYDAGFSAGANIDGTTFIAPIRQGINPYDTDANGNFLSPYSPGDSVYVEIHSITLAAFNFLTEAKYQVNRPGGFSELFASPLANVSTNITNVNPRGKQALGFFNVGTVSGAGKRLVK